MAGISDCETYEANTSWGELVALAWGAPGVDPDPDQLCARLQTWSRLFESAYGGYPKMIDFPAPVQGFFERISKVRKKPGRPRCDQQQLIKARNAWEARVLKTNYEMRQSTIKFFGRRDGVSQCFGFDKETMKNESPSSLAVAKIADELNLSENYVRTKLFPSNRK